MKRKEMNQWSAEAKDMINETQQADKGMIKLQEDLHQIVANTTFYLFPFLPDKMEANEIRLLGERISRHLYSLTEEIKNFAFTVQKRLEE
jgi:hypothetical protein